jgi:hypothetical protein
LKEDSRKTVLYGSWFIARSAGAATKSAPKTRPIVIFDRNLVAGEMLTTFAAKKFTKSGEVVLIPIPEAKTKPEARLDKRAKIKKRGLAKDAWRWIIGDLGRSTGKTNNKRRGSYFLVEQFLDKVAGPEIRLTNRLRYASLAFKTKGRATVSNIGSRANNAMRKDLDRRVARTARKN